MSEALEIVEKEDLSKSPQKNKESKNKLYQVVFREGRQVHSCVSKIQNLSSNEFVMVQTDHGPEPAKLKGRGALLPLDELNKKNTIASIIRRTTREEIDKYQTLIQRENDTFVFCHERIEKLGLVMKLISVERYFNGSKIIFYFTAESRVDFRVLVKELVQEFRTRVEMRQIGVRHETQMLGGLGCCGRELCCSLFMKKFVPVSIKMAKEQDLPLNPAKISGACNRLLCCLTHEFETYKSLKKNMPKAGRTVIYEGIQYRVTQCNTLKELVTLVASDDRDNVQTLGREEWPKLQTIGKPKKKPESGQNTGGRQNPKGNQGNKGFQAAKGTKKGKKK